MESDSDWPVVVALVVSFAGLVAMFVFDLQPGRGSLMCKTPCPQLHAEAQALVVDAVWAGTIVLVAIAVFVTIARYHATD